MRYAAVNLKMAESDEAEVEKQSIVHNIWTSEKR